MKKTTWAILVLGTYILCMSMISCKKDSNTKPTLYDSLGGTTMVNDPTTSGVKIESGRLTIRSIVDSAIFVIAADSRINGYFTVLLGEVTVGNLSGFQALSKNLTDFIAVGTGAKDYKYTGKSMVAAHDPAQNPRINGKVANDDFDAFEQDLGIAAGKNGVASTDSRLVSLGNIVESLRGMVVQK